MTDHSPTEQVKVTQADRDAAADLALAVGYAEWVADRRRNGDMDLSATVQAFARHRINSTRPTASPNAGLAARIMDALRRDDMGAHADNERQDEWEAMVLTPLLAALRQQPSPADEAMVERVAPYLVGHITKTDPDYIADEDGKALWEAEVQVSGGHSEIARTWAGTEQEARRQAEAIAHALTALTGDGMGDEGER